MTLKQPKGSGRWVSENANTFPQQQKSRIEKLFIIPILLGIFITLYSCGPNDDRPQRLAIATEILQNNCDDVIQLSTEHVKRKWLQIGISIVESNRCNCIVDSLIPRLADKYSLEVLKELKTKSFGDVIQTTQIIEENSEVIKDCALFKR
jgi:hypothetical protein